MGLLLGLALLFYLGARQVVVRNAREEVAGLTRQTARSLEATLGSVQVSGRTLAAGAAAVGRQPFNLRSLLHATLQGDPDIAGALLVIAPGALKGDDRGFAWRLRRARGSVVEQPAGALGFDYRSMPWYRRALAAPAPWWSEPYRNAATGDAFTTYNLPLRLPGDGPQARAIGMVSVDVPLQRLQAIIDELPANAGLQPMLLSPDGLIVLHPDPALRFRRGLQAHVAQARPDLAPLAAAVAAHAPVRFAHVAPDGERYLTQSAAVGDSDWTFALTASERYIVAGLNRIALWVGLGGGAALLLWLWLLRRYTARLVAPIEDLTDSAVHFGQGEFDYPLRHAQRQDEVGVMARAFDRARGSIKLQLQEIATLAQARQRMQSELSIARDIQRAMLPDGRTFDSAHKHLETYALLEPATMVGGDFYQFFETVPGLLWFVVGDVSDKGVPAALFMARAMTVLEVAARRHDRPDAILIAASQRLVEGNETCMFATVLCGLIDVHSGDYWLSSAGHEPPVLLGADGRAQLLAVESGPPLGIETQTHYPVLRGRLAAGATLLSYTDGITEAMDAHDQAYGEARLLAALQPGIDAQAQCARVLAAVHAFTTAAPQSDDMTLLAIRLRQDPMREAST
ncbi:IcfG protein [Xanthomonas theicola]|uniref:IcfG protein n=1 Tax=Xanthomonas theicola TaxID=56464 RepID=A0A2S6ZIX0_9XANT|nr:SpoIIE family protein phosphatase [Xanthomonas theicola]PPT92222.1 IcfG protein [Xanthomonas theicola]QNH25846.1 SpoIIE family protein phosphatase [Xanthomonas theicola]